MSEIRVSDRAVLRYLERAHGLDIEAVRQHIAGRCANAILLGAISVKVERVRFMLANEAVTSVRPARWPVARLPKLEGDLDGGL